MKNSRLLFKAYLGCMLCLLLITGASFVFFLSNRSGRKEDVLFRTERYVHELARTRRDPEALRATIARLQRHTRHPTSLYDLDGRLLASTVDPPLAMISRSDLEQLAQRDHIEPEPSRYVHAVKEDRRLVAIGIVNQTRPPLEQILAILGGLLISFLGVALVFARHLVTPLQRIASAARRFGQGDLRARAQINRRDEIGEVGRAFDEMADRVTHLMRVQQELLANVSHELQTPISRIHVAVDLMRDGIAEQASELLPEIAQDLGELERLIADIMTVARLDLSRSPWHAARTLLRLEPLTVAELIESAAARFRQRHDTHPLTLQLSEPLPGLVGDRVLLRRVIENLLENARKYSEPGSLITISATAAASRVSVRVIDTGIGMDEADLKQVFTPFFRSDRSRSRATGGVGLGLVLARRVVEAHQGSLTLRSAPGQGTEATVDLPAE